MKWSTNSLRWNIVIRMLMSIVCVWLVFAALLVWQTNRNTNQILLQQHTQFTDMLWENLGDEDDLQRNPLHHSKHPRGLEFAIYDLKTGEVLNASSAPALPLQPNLQNQAHQTEFAQKMWLISSRQNTDVQLVVGLPLAITQTLAHDMAQNTGWFSLIGLLLLCPALYWALRIGLRPIDVFTRMVATRSPEQLTPIHADTPDELSPLRDRLNHLFKQVEANLQREKRFTADAAHELRTPLAAMRIQLELAEHSTRSDIRQKAFGHANTAIKNATHLVAQLLQLARLEHGARLEMQSINLPQLARAALIEAGLPYDGSHLKIESDTNIVGSDILMHTLMRNLVDNTQKYGGASAQVFITITPSGFVFIDTGIGASPQTHQRLGERFYRPAGQAAVGSGLGWSIIERICEIHHAHISSFEVAPHGFGVHFKIV